MDCNVKPQVASWSVTGGSTDLSPQLIRGFIAPAERLFTFKMKSYCLQLPEYKLEGHPRTLRIRHAVILAQGFTRSCFRPFGHPYMTAASLCDS